MENNVIDQQVEPSVTIRGLSVRFSERTVLDRISFTACPGRIIVIVGPSGSGKTTLLRAVNRLNECFPNCRTEGSVELRLNGRDGDIYRDFVPLPDLRRNVGMVFQTPSVLPFSTRKNLAMPLKVTLGLDGARLSERVEWALREVSLWDEVKDRLHADASTLSGGQQQRLCLARVLALEPQILLLDEPTASLDFKATEKIEELLTRLKKRYTILAVSHSLSQTRRLADRVCVLREGRIVRELDHQHLQDLNEFQRLVEDAF
ncbi:phosphate ABC transporter ATP-binding protein [Syntrophobacter fumaroxidans]|uniref:ABC transporter related n=1 Tax=Syntrophobacter fumaroxidans (strain DSM 10017 / MPOB) TaxID=335543 RepID=A0LEY2_SYNFM|nr:phosphate ABC transporter ATP-binding protein [Syntrophobacter fumaroxidans]ABK15984.1 ABC transporter related [Syntrophobacter fumaroxidans MPOB]